MNEAKSKAKDPVCGMNVDKATALHTEREGETYYFCGDKCQKKFLSPSFAAKSEDKSGGAKSEGKSGCC